MGFYSFSCDIAVSREEEIDTPTVCLTSLLEFFGPPFFSLSWQQYFNSLFLIVFMDIFFLFF